jgi:hypothetical protein
MYRHGEVLKLQNEVLQKKERKILVLLIAMYEEKNLGNTVQSYYVYYTFAGPVGRIKQGCI